MRSELDKAADFYYGKITKALWVDGKIVTNKQSFIDGVLWFLQRAEKMVYPSGVDSEGEAVGDERYWVKLDDLKRLCGGGDD